MTATATIPADDPKVLAEEVELRIADIDPDPAQPRLEVDDDLASSIKEHGVLKAIEVRPHPEHPDRWMIVDGERRWRGSKKAGRSTIAAKITFDVEGISLAGRMIRQIVHNTGRPLSAVEEALAFRKIIDERRAGVPATSDTGIGKGSGALSWLVKPDTKYGAVALARELGIAKSTVTDRLAVTEIPKFWFTFIAKGPLQPSHVPALHKIREMPEKYQLRVLTRLQEHHEWPTPTGTAANGHRHRKAVDGERIQVEEFERMLQDALRPFVRPMSDVGASYKGPTAKLKDGGGYYSSVKVMAIDPGQWEPILRKRRQDKAAKTRAAGGAEAKAAKQADQYRAQQARYAAERKRADEKRRLWWKARPQILAALAEKIATMSLGQLQSAVIETLGVQKDSKAVAKLAAKGTTAEQFVRHLAMCAIADSAGHEWGFTDEATKIGKRFGVNVAAIVKDKPDDAQKAPDPATTDPGEAGAGLLAVDGDEDGDDA